MPMNRSSSRHLRPPILGLASLTFLTLTLLACQAETPEVGAVPDVSADFRLPSLEGPEVSPLDFSGQVVLVDFWATWCVPCHKQAEVLHEIYEEIRGSGVQFLAVDLGEDEETVRKYVEEKPFPYPVLLDPEDNLTYEMGIFGLPTVMVIDRQGKVTYFETGLIPKADLVAELRKAGLETS